jgi:hypothetical protein
MKTGSKRYVVFILIIILTLFRGLRWERGTDWENYFFIFNNTTWSNFLHAPKGFGSSTPIEAGYAFLNVLIHSIGDYTLFLMITNFFICISYAYYAFKYSNTPIIMFVIINFSIQFFPIRETLAFTILLYAFSCIIEKKMWTFIVITMLSFLIHRSYILFLPFYFILRQNFPFIIRIGIFIGANLFLSTSTLANIILFVGEKIAGILPTVANLMTVYVYASRVYEGKRDNLVISNIVSILFLITFEIYKYKINDKKGKVTVDICINAYLISTLIPKIFSGELMGEFVRLASIFGGGFPLIASLSFDYYRKKYSSIIFILLVLFLIYRYFGMRMSYPKLHFPYRSIFTG